MNLKKIDKFMGVNLVTYYLIYLFTFLLTFNTSKNSFSLLNSPIHCLLGRTLAWDAGPLSLRSWTNQFTEFGVSLSGLLLTQRRL